MTIPLLWQLTVVFDSQRILRVYIDKCLRQRNSAYRRFIPVSDYHGQTGFVIYIGNKPVVLTIVPVEELPYGMGLIDIDLIVIP